MSTLTAPQSPAFMDSRCHHMLQTALLGGEQARLMYLHAAQTMEDAGLHVVAHALRFTAAQEKEHAAIFSGLLHFFGGAFLPPEETVPPLRLGPAELLRTFTHQEAEKAERLCAHDASIAAEEGYPRIAAALRRIGETEARHARRFSQYEAALSGGTLFREERPVTWFCLHCGELRTGCEPPEKCPSCGKNRGHFIRSSHFPFAVEG